MQTKCDVCKKDCVCKGCTKNNTCKYVSNDQCKVVVTCGMLTQLPGLQWQQQPKKNRTLKN